MTRRTKLRHLAPVLLGVLATMVAGCGDENAKPNLHLSGHVHYESVPYTILTDGLDYSQIAQRPIRGARVVLLDIANDNILAETTSSEEGTYSLAWSGTKNVKVWLYAETTVPPIVVADNTSLDAKYVLESKEIVGGASTTLDMVAGLGWTGMSYEKPRQSAPFALLDAAYTAAKRFLDEGKPTPKFPKLQMSWSVDNRPEDGNVQMGQIGTSYWGGDAIYILGKEDVDTDEFDSHVIVHEWGHSFEDFISRSDNPGGSHQFGDVLDPRIAFSEGFCNALSAMILDPDTVYADSSGVQQTDGFTDDIDDNDPSAIGNPGWYSETSVQNIVFDVYDDDQTGIEDFDKVGVGIPGIYAAMIGGVKTTSAMTSLFPFVTAIKAYQPGAASAIDTLVTYHGSGGSFGIDPIADDWGTGETHSGDDPNAVPIYVKMKIGDSKTVTMTGGLKKTLLGQNRFLRFTGNGASVTISTTSAEDVDLYVYLRGKEVTKSVTTDGIESTKLATKSGEEYVVYVQGFGMSNGPYNTTVTVTP